MEKLKVVKIETVEQALIESIKIWKVLSKSPDGTKKTEVVEFGYWCNCPLCEYFSKFSWDYENKCENCPIYRCQDGIQPYGSWVENQTAENAKRVLEQLEEKLKGYKEV